MKHGQVNINPDYPQAAGKTSIHVIKGNMRFTKANKSLLKTNY